MSRRPATNPLVLLPSHPSATVVRIDMGGGGYGYYVNNTFDDANSIFEAAMAANGIAAFDVASDEGVKLSVHWTRILVILDVRTRT